MKNSNNNETNWSIYESNVQAYRSNFIASQSFMLAVGAIVLEKTFFLTAVVSILAIIQIWYIWFRTIRVRTILVDFYKYNICKLFNNNGDLINKKSKHKIDENTYIKNKNIRKKVNKNISEYLYKGKKKFHNFRLTRIKLDIVIPVSYTIIWVAFLCYSYSFCL